MTNHMLYVILVTHAGCFAAGAIMVWRHTAPARRAAKQLQRVKAVALREDVMEATRVSEALWGAIAPGART